MKSTSESRCTSLVELFDKEFADRSVEDVTYLNSKLLEKFRRFTQKQASAIHAWLCFVRPWPELYWDSECIDSAIGYWKRKAEGNDS